MFLLDVVVHAFLHTGLTGLTVMFPAEDRVRLHSLNFLVTAAAGLLAQMGAHIRIADQCNRQDEAPRKRMESTCSQRARPALGPLLNLPVQ